MIISKEGTVRGIRHRVNKIKKDFLNSSNQQKDSGEIMLQVYSHQILDHGFILSRPRLDLFFNTFKGILFSI